MLRRLPTLPAEEQDPASAAGRGEQPSSCTRCWAQVTLWGGAGSAMFHARTLALVSRQSRRLLQGNSFSAPPLCCLPACVPLLF